MVVWVPFQFGVFTPGAKCIIRSTRWWNNDSIVIIYSDGAGGTSISSGHRNVYSKITT